MKRGWVWVVMLLGAVACGGGAGLPTDDGGPGGDDSGPDPAGSDDGRNMALPPLPEGTLWPLTAGSTWMYRIHDPDVGQPFEKTVRVLGEAAVPQSAGVATVVTSEQPFLNYVEKSWQVVKDGIALRVREEDRRSGFLVRVTTWDPATVKSIADVPPDLAWVHVAQINETVQLMADGSVTTKPRQYTWRVLSLNETVTVPAGTFQTVKIHRERTDNDKLGKGRTYWLAPGVGKVKEDGERLEELLFYDVK
ncbi:MAG: hypothetical protein L0Y66_16945 [Myxococcaceae bacterium]|nr:hypothetical protein [Myxococcaceae bacterium]MCI0672956.1 hypothetical protein [Myxococcaceae bacterium]